MKQKSNKSSSKLTEIIAGLTSFSAMAYILFVNPSILSSTGLNAEAVFIATCVSAGLGCLLVGWLADYPIAIAPGMGLNVYFALVLVDKLGYSWQMALAASFLAALLFLFVVISGLSKHITKAIPSCLHIGVLIGLGFLLITLALKNINLWQFHNGHIQINAVSPKIIFISCLGFGLIFLLNHFKISAAIIIAVITTSCIGFLFANAHFYGIIALPHHGSFYLPQMDFKSMLNVQGISIVLSLFLVLFFDCAGTFIGLLQQANLPVRPKNLSHALLSASCASTVGSVLGTSGLSAYAESAAGIKAGGRTGITSITIGCLFLLALLFSPLARSIPDYATAPALLYVGFIMVRGLRLLDWKDPVLLIPSLLTAVLIPITFSIANGIAAGVLSFIILAWMRKKRHHLSASLLLLGGIFIIYCVLLFIR